MGESQLSFRRFADVEIFDVAASENNIFVDFVSRRQRAIRGPFFRSKRANLRQRYGTLIWVDSVQNTLVTDIRLQISIRGYLPRNRKFGKLIKSKINGTAFASHEIKRNKGL